MCQSSSQWQRHRGFLGLETWAVRGFARSLLFVVTPVSYFVRQDSGTLKPRSLSHKAIWTAKSGGLDAVLLEVDGGLFFF